MSRQKFFITTAISYPNGAPHIGHAYEAVATDAIARFKRLDDFDVFFMTGVDEHGQKMVKTAEKEGISPKELSDKNTKLFQDMCSAFNISYDRFIRTTEPAHYKSVQALWDKMVERGDIYLSTYEGWYSVRQEAYYEESETLLKEDGSRFETENGTLVEWTKEDTYFFRLSAYQEKLLELYRKNPSFVAPSSRFNEVISFVKSGLKDLSISRTTFNWGIPVPNAPEHVMYVWVDALANYLTGCGYPDLSGERGHFWPADLHVIGKDIVRFHAIYWPAFLMSADIELPKQIFGHGFLLNRGEKMSKSLGNIVDPFSLVSHYGVDPIRFFFLREVSFGQDGAYSHEAIVNRINADLANDFGNLAQRSLSMVAKNCSGKVPHYHDYTQDDHNMLLLSENLLDRVRHSMENYQIHIALQEIWHIVSEANRYFASQEPWKEAKLNLKRMETILYVTIETLRKVALLTQAFVPDISSKLLDYLGISEEQREFIHFNSDYSLVPGSSLPQPFPLVKRYEEQKVEG